MMRYVYVAFLSLALHACAPQASNPNSELANPVTFNWAERHPWVNPNGGDPDSDTVIAIGRQLLKEGGNPHTQVFWDELTMRVKKALPQHFLSPKEQKAFAAKEAVAIAKQKKEYCLDQGYKLHSKDYKYCIANFSKVMADNEYDQTLRKEQLHESQPQKMQQDDCSIAPRDMSGAEMLLNSGSPNAVAFAKMQIAEENARQQRNALRCGDKESYFRLKQLEIQQKQLNKPSQTNCSPDGSGGFICIHR